MGNLTAGVDGFIYQYIQTGLAMELSEANSPREIAFWLLQNMGFYCLAYKLPCINGKVNNSTGLK